MIERGKKKKKNHEDLKDKDNSNKEFNVEGVKGQTHILHYGHRSMKLNLSADNCCHLKVRGLPMCDSVFADFID